MNLIVSDVESRSLQLSWEAPPTEVVNGIIRKYLVNLTALDSGAERIVESFATSLEINNLHPYTRYTISVSAFTVRKGPGIVDVVEMLQDSKCPTM